MGEVIYSTTPFQTFMWSFLIILLLIVFGIAGILTGIFRRGEKTLLRIARAGSGIFLCLIGAVFGFLVFRSITSGAQSIDVHLNDKQIVEANCNDGDTCTRYVLETESGTKLYDIDVSKSAYDKAQIELCYKVTYFPGNGFFAQPETEYSYHSISNVTRIETTACQ